MITEDYVSFEIAKLLKEKGFDVPYYYCTRVYSDNGTLQGINSVRFRGVEYISAPTLQMAMKWLREVHNFFIDVSYDEEEFGDKPYFYLIIDFNTGDYVKGHKVLNDCTYEKACENAIKFCLENLI